MSTGTRQARTVAREIGRQRRGDVLLYDLTRFLDSIAECREEYTGQDIRQQRSDDTDTRDPVELVGAAGVLQEPPQRVRKLESRPGTGVCAWSCSGPSLGPRRWAGCCWRVWQYCLS